MSMYRVRKRISDGSSVLHPGVMLTEEQVSSWTNLHHMLRAGMLEEVPVVVSPADPLHPTATAPLSIDLEPVA